MALKAVSFLCTGQQQGPKTAVTKKKREKEKPWRRRGLCRVTPQLRAQDAGGVPRPGSAGGRAVGAVGAGWGRSVGEVVG